MAGTLGQQALKAALLIVQGQGPVGAPLAALSWGGP